MQIPFFDLKRQIQNLKPELDEAINRVLGNGNFILGEEVSKFEQEFASYLSVAHCITCANGTDALELVLEALGIGRGDEVILPAFGWVSGAHAVRRARAKPVFVDVEISTGNIDVRLVQDAITDQTKAVMPIHLYGNPCDITTLRNICDKHQLYLIEDCAQAHGAEVEGQKVGTFGDAAIFSFYPTKNLGCFGDGGAVVTNDKNLADQIRMLRDYGRDGSGKFLFDGRNSRLDEIQAAVLRVKLGYLDQWNARRKEIASTYESALKGEGIVKSDGSVHHQCVISVSDRDALRSHLEKSGIRTAIHYEFIDTAAHHFTQSNTLCQSVLSLPCFPELTEKEIVYICDELVLLQAQNL
ncbi:DegT/DnrJ/EryC1/StrS family aminotransferase [Marinoscillum sp.]|uniref:DegT/DnrJ/EryC1/StrS family aminotransferase n=1 Tax=Marinoscillum sp. TaxID=2024838 RepID=UPI003BAA15C9